MCTQILVFMLLIKCIFSIITHPIMPYLYMKSKITMLYCYVLKFKSLFEKPSNWCFHYIMIHLDKTPNQAI
uniref:Uncharacterized protein n=1 Tax=Piliocolobus tephrosceles TaxID=591936 RepID=A0A8C9GU40_9PRIM